MAICSTCKRSNSFKRFSSNLSLADNNIGPSTSPAKPAAESESAMLFSPTSTAILALAKEACDIIIAVSILVFCDSSCQKFLLVSILTLSSLLSISIIGSIILSSV